MTKIAVLDSGTGGLTTLTLLIQTFPFCDFYYLADNAHMPYGNRSSDELQDIVKSLIGKLKAHGDICVLACNTASQIAEDEDVFKLTPSTTPQGDSLVLATPATISAIKAKEEFKDNRYRFAHTPELASLIETCLCVGARKNCLNMRDALPYLAHRLKEFKGVENVVLGCSHYLYVKDEIKRILGAVKFFDGNENLIEALRKELLEETKRYERNKEICLPRVSFDFTADDESIKYDKILNLLTAQANS